ncbi:autotransporter outer membrane beta-barrel domain-containing protein, partial [Campylobacter sp. BCW_6463]|uniref:autotransporter outer membrane beta-barrel domain-containing protein n=1 Tax=Campylobacter sp. BCW_6463 TaxID=1903580 RepID=UPI0011D0E2F2
KEPCLNSKKIVLSLATISFLASCANATLNSEIKTYDEANKNTKARSASVYQNTNTTVSGSETSTINISDSGPHTIIIQSGGTLGSIGNTDRIIYAHASSNNTLTLTNLTNHGTINGKVAVEHDNNFKGTITVNTFENTGQINGQIYMGIWGGNSGTLTVDKFENSGTIVGSNDRGVLFEGKNTNIQSFVNSGLISGSEGVTMVGGTIENFINNGTMNGGSSAVFIHNSIIKTLENKGTINSTEDIWWGGAIKLENGGTIENIINTGTINSVVSGIHVSYGKFGTLTIKDGGVVYGKTAGIWVNQWQTLGDLYIDGGKNTSKDGTVSGIYSDNHGIALDVGSSTSKIELKNGGIIQGKVNGIRLEKAASLSGEIILSGEGSRVEGGSGAGISNESGKIEGSIKVEDGATVTSSSGQAISNSGSGSITGGITVSGENTKLEGNIVNTDSASIGSDIKIEGGAKVEGGLVNEGEGSITGSITIDKNSQLDSITNTSNSNTGISGSITNNSDNKLEISNGEGATIGGGITNNGNADLVISNQGSVGKDKDGNTVTNNGSGSVGIKDWVVSTDKNTGKLDTVVVGGSGANNVQVENITVDQSNVNLEELGNISNIISGVNQNNIGNIGTNGGGEISLSFDPITGKLTTDFNLNASISGATFRSLISTTSRRSTFIDNVMGNSMQSFALASSSKSQSIAMSEKGNLYADASDYIKSDLNNGSYGSNKEHSLFILPYASSQNVELSLNEESKGHTKGTIIGYSTLKDSGIYGVYAGYEDTRMGSTYFDINNRTYYAGLKYFNTLFTTEKGQEVYIKAQGKAALIKNDLTKKIGNNEAKAEPNSYAYGVNTALGMNFISNKDIFSPEIGLAYEGGYTEAFSMKDTIGQATVKGGERTYANYLNLFSTKTSFTWFRDWLPNLKTSVELGAKFNINPKVEAKARFGNIKVSDEFYLPRIQKFVSTSFIVPVNEAFYFSLNYNGMFDKDGNTHTGFAQFNYLW